MFLGILKRYVFSFLISLGFCIGLGFWDYILKIKEILYFFTVLIITTLFFVWLNGIKNIIFKIIINIMLIFACIYIAGATGFLQGHMSLGIVASLMQTNLNECYEFLSQIHWKFIIFSIILYGLSFYFFNIRRKIQHENFKIFLIIILLLGNVFSIFLIQTLIAVRKYKKEEQILIQNNKLNVDWKISAVQANYDVQIFIIGESVQREFLSLYGFKEKTTPFLDRMPVHMIDHYISAAPNTVTSLTRTLALLDSNHEIDIAKNVVSLAKQAKYNTIWISNQGFMGKNDTAISKMSIHADHQLYLKTGNYMSKNIDDDELIPLLSKQLDKSKHKRNVVFLHMMGSHPDACERLFSYSVKYPQYSEKINCYLSSINKLDHFIEKLYYVLKEKKEKFAITYFSDHGMTVDDEKYYVDNDLKSNYSVPFFQLTSDETEKKHWAKRVSAYDFMNIYAGFLGIKTPFLDGKRSIEQIPDNSNIQVFNWENYITFDSLKNNPNLHNE